MKKLLIFLAVLTWTSLTLNAQQGEIIYIDFEPDSLVELKQYDLYPESKMMIDFDYDGHPDIRITSYVYSAGGWFDMICYEPEWELHEFRPCDTLTPMNEPEHYWSTRIAWMWDYCNGIDTISDKFAVRHKVGDAYYYGWFRVYITRCPPSPYPWVALDKMAYCTDPNYPLVWGQTTISQSVEEETVENLISVYPNPANGTLFVETFPETSPNETVTSFETFQETSLHTYRIINMMGQTILSGHITAETQRINIESLPAGMYFISLGDMTQKFIVK